MSGGPIPRLALAGLMAWLGAATANPARSQPPVGSLDPVTSGAVDSTAWIAMPADSSLDAAADSLDVGSHPSGEISASNREIPLPPVEVSPVLAPIQPKRVLASVASGVYGGYPSWGGAMIVAPADGPAAFRSGITGLPNIGILWTPGFEIRFDQPSGTFASDGGFFYGNLFLGRSYLDGRRDHTAMESGLGYRWILTDRRGLRWIAALEAGGYWRPESAWPYRPSLRAYWLLVE